MPKVAETKVGTRNRERSAHTIEFLVDGEPSENGDFWDSLLDEESPFYQPMITKGLVLTEGEDYRILDSDGKVATMKSAPEKVRRIVNIEVAERLNVPTTVRLPKGGENVSVADRNWVSFRPKIDAQFPDEATLAEYIEKQQ